MWRGSKTPDELTRNPILNGITTAGKAFVRSTVELSFAAQGYKTLRKWLSGRDGKKTSRGQRKQPTKVRNL